MSAHHSRARRRKLREAHEAAAMKTADKLSVVSPSKLEAATAWLVAEWGRVPMPWTRALRERFGLGFNDAASAMAEARRRVEEAR